MSFITPTSNTTTISNYVFIYPLYLNISYYLAKYNKNNNTVDIYPVPKVYSLKQHVKNFEPSVAVDELDGVDERERRKILTNAFGSKVKKKALSSYEAGKVDVNAIGASSGGTHLSVNLIRIIFSLVHSFPSFFKTKQRSKLLLLPILPRRAQLLLKLVVKLRALYLVEISFLTLTNMLPLLRRYVFCIIFICVKY